MQSRAHRCLPVTYVLRDQAGFAATLNARGSGPE